MMEKKDKVFSGHQPNFLPYMGVVYKMHESDIFVIDDDVQYSSKGLHNANFIRLGDRKNRIVIPVSAKYGQNINEVEISYSAPWQKKMLKTIRHAYGKAEHFREVTKMVEDHFAEHPRTISELNISLLKDIVERMNLGCRLVVASKEVPTNLKKNDRNIFQCLSLGCNVYYSGTGGKAYNDEELYRANKIQLKYSDYKPFEYRQIGEGFIENLSVLDYLMNEGFSMPSHWKK